MERMARKPASAFLDAIRDKEQRDEDAETLSVIEDSEVMAETALDKLLIRVSLRTSCVRGSVRALDDSYADEQQKRCSPGWTTRTRTRSSMSPSEVLQSVWTRP